MSSLVVYRWIAEARAKPSEHPRMRCGTREQARRARDAMNALGRRAHVVRRLKPPVYAPVSENPWLEPERQS